MRRTDIILVVLGQTHVNILAMPSDLLSLAGGGWRAGARGEGGAGREDREAAAARQDGGENTIGVLLGGSKQLCTISINIDK